MKRTTMMMPLMNEEEKGRRKRELLFLFMIAKGGGRVGCLSAFQDRRRRGQKIRNGEEREATSSTLQETRAKKTDKKEEKWGGGEVGLRHLRLLNWRTREEKRRNKQLPWHLATRKEGRRRGVSPIEREVEWGETLFCAAPPPFSVQS